MGYIINKDGISTGNFPEDVDITESMNSSRQVDLLQKQHEEQCKQNKRMRIINAITALVSIGTLIISIISLFK